MCEPEASNNWPVELVIVCILVELNVEEVLLNVFNV